MTGQELREVDVINAVAAAVRQHATAAELSATPAGPANSMTFRATFARAFPKVVAAQLATIDASLTLVDWWAAHPPDPSLVFGSATAVDLQGKVAQLDRDRYARCREKWRGRVKQATTDLLDTRLTGEDPWRATAAVQTDMTGLIGPLLSSAQNFAVYVHDRSRDQFLGAFKQAAQQRQPGIEVRITEQNVMPDGGVVTTRDELIPPAEQPDTAPRRRRWWHQGRR